jgi:hypothetical protein
VAVAPEDKNRRRQEILKILESLPEVWEIGQQRIELSFIAEPEDRTAAMEVIYEQINDGSIRAEISLEKSEFSIRARVRENSERNVDSDRSKNLTDKLKKFKRKLIDSFRRRP